ncbi:head GIN domain-containing protein [Pseudobacteriovorax antillogorgiicola]|uniref:Putative auto-transporter adhesin, head GIN domain n=1 Tax=Pseudobacteriovorax antillogorgiicola TaxID=1513793 RepID=A0A1Y6BN07_9BACT|nr:head GIN domain-containing protein [Pseudobacteriovorax antillogorgiicola]TCS55534.1 putative autotransporter adhesin-like protein [Pseudobacteriovorax antillogorgiicola]SMF11244.1 Putative auto-transporter adhesin, head GIN domain [Pseudobacteriovorax antillogorgiicola]
MKNWLILAYVALQASSAWAIFDCVPGVEGSVSRVESLKAVHQIVIKVPHDVLVRKSSRPRLEIKGPKDLVQNLNFSVANGQIEIDQEKCSRNDQSVEIVAYMSDLSRLEILGSSDVDILDEFSGKEAVIDISGAGDVLGSFRTTFMKVMIKGSGEAKLKGQTESLHIDIWGSGDVSSEKMAAQNVRVSIKGTGDVNVQAEKTLKVDVYGVGDVRYRGKPQIEYAKYGTGSLKSF